MATSAFAWLSEPLLRAAAEPLIVERGREYAEDGLVDLETVTGTVVTATVHGSEPYHVELASRGGALTGTCTCPYAEDGSFCKHLVAAALTATGLHEPQPSEAAEASPGGGEADVMAWLEQQDHADLVALLLNVADEHPDVRRDLEAQAAAAQGVAPSIDLYEAELAAAFDTEGFVPWGEMFDWSRGVHAALDELAELLDAGFADEVVRLAERGLAELERAVGHVDDSGGELIGIGERLVDLHVAALRAADATDRAEAGRRVFALAAAGGELEVLPDRLGEYSGALGSDGWQALCEAAQAAWEEVSARRPGDDEPDRYGHRRRLTRIMEALAGDLDALLAVRAKSLAHPSDWVRVVAACADAGRDDLAVEWGEQGLEAFGADADARLSDALSDAYQRTGRLADALDLERRQFRRHPSAARYRRLRAAAEALEQWSAEREEAHRVACEHVAAAERETKETSRHLGRWQPAGSLLVVLHLEDGDVDDAWAEACAQGCSEDLWLRLAELRADAHPDDAVAVYRRRLDRALKPAKNHAYDEVVDLLRTLQPLYARAGRDGDFAELVAEIREGYKRRPNLIERLDRAGL